MALRDTPHSTDEALDEFCEQLEALLEEGETPFRPVTIAISVVLVGVSLLIQR